jgi:hypothetical protein
MPGFALARAGQHYAHRSGLAGAVQGQAFTHASFQIARFQSATDELGCMVFARLEVLGNQDDQQVTFLSGGSGQIQGFDFEVHN